MPILEVTVVGDPPTQSRKGWAGRLAEAAGAVFKSGPGNTWVVVHQISTEDYAENGAGPGGPHAPVFVRVLKRSLPPEPELAIEVEALARAVADVCGRDPAQVHVIYEPGAAGRVALGGRLVP